jgi:hypothetical protein
MNTRPHRLCRIVSAIMVCACAAFAHDAVAADWPADKLGDAAVWDAAYDAASGARFVPMQLILPALWSGERRVDFPAIALFIDPDGDRWKGPVDDTDVFSGATMQAYQRSRYTKREGSVDQRFAVRSEQDGLGRVYDSRFGEIRCSGEIKFPLGEWKQGEVRRNEFTCKSARGQPKKRLNTITVEKIDFVCRGVAHCLQFTWKHEIEGEKEPSDYRRYVFAPGLGEITHDRLR